MRRTHPTQLALWAPLAVMLGCRPSASSSSAQLGGAGSPSAGVDAAYHAGTGGISSTAPDASALTAAVQPWVPHSDDPSCQHVQVIPDCKQGWCSIPSGCFVMGSPAEEDGRAMYGEDLTTVYLTRSFEIGQFEVTRARWADTGWELPYGSPAIEVASGHAACDESQCAMDRLSWFAALQYANWLSEHATPPLPPCYQLVDCQATTDNPALCFSADGCTAPKEYLLNCSGVTVTSATGSVYDCEGYRLPTEPEWEYAARAGSRTTYFAGAMSDAVMAAGDDCLEEPALMDWAWYCKNSPSRAQPVGLRGANAWGLHDILGNVVEFVSNPRYTSFTTPAPVTDPWGNVDFTLRMAVRGGCNGHPPEALRLAGRGSRGLVGSLAGGFRVVRTLPSK